MSANTLLVEDHEIFSASAVGEGSISTNIHHRELRCSLVAERR
jgi:hypothetical protein